jgi:hypothetical protein
MKWNGINDAIVVSYISSFGLFGYELLSVRPDADSACYISLVLLNRMVAGVHWVGIVFCKA